MTFDDLFEDILEYAHELQIDVAVIKQAKTLFAITYNEGKMTGIMDCKKITDKV
jgi:hypothetical protein